MEASLINQRRADMPHLTHLFANGVIICLHHGDDTGERITQSVYRGDDGGMDFTLKQLEIL